MNDTRKWNYSCFAANLSYLVVTELVVVENAEFVVEISTLSVTLLKM